MLERELLSVKIGDAAAAGKAKARTCMAAHIIAHELLHLVGLYHEHVRPDRDLFVAINTNNVLGYAKHNYAEMKIANTLGLPYDYTSIMHYHDRQFGVLDAGGNQALVMTALYDPSCQVEAI